MAYATGGAAFIELLTHNGAAELELAAGAASDASNRCGGARGALRADRHAERRNPMTRLRGALVLALGALVLGACRDREAGLANDAHGPGHTDAPVEGYAALELDAERVQRFGIRTEPVRREALTREVRTVGVVRTDETRESHVHVKWEGWIQEFFVSYVGQEVKRGDPLFSVYSPDLVTAQQELLVARARADAAASSARASERASAEALLETAHEAALLRHRRRRDRPDREGAPRAARVTVRAPRAPARWWKLALPGCT
jgi:Cu(I)/Ag(I) efflux system membrane fusion protein